MSNNLEKVISKEQKTKQYHSEEIMLILSICAAELSNYDDGDDALTNRLQKHRKCVNPNKTLKKAGWRGQFSNFWVRDLLIINEFIGSSNQSNYLLR